uniref:Putative secreted protein n=1 Tax=Ixodes ricinus TaxID=34613 RepID=A0A6B0UMC3_IXORI
MTRPWTRRALAWLAPSHSSLPFPVFGASNAAEALSDCRQPTERVSVSPDPRAEQSKAAVEEARGRFDGGKSPPGRFDRGKFHPDGRKCSAATICRSREFSSILFGHPFRGWMRCWAD